MRDQPDRMETREVDKPLSNTDYLRQVAEDAAALPGHMYQRVVTWVRGTPSAPIDRTFLHNWTPERALLAIAVIECATELHHYLTGDVPESNAVIDACYDRTEKALSAWNDETAEAGSAHQGEKA